MKKLLLPLLGVLLFTTCKKNNNSPVETIPSVTIGTQVWMLKNLDVNTYRNGDPIPHVTAGPDWAALTTGAWCYYDNDSATYAAIYGKLYNWYAVNDSRGLAPVGRHVPNNAEWNILVKYIDPAADTTIGGIQSATAGGAMKETGTTHWSSPNTGATNSSGFTGLPGGGRFPNGTFVDVGDVGVWWSATETNASSAWYRVLVPDHGALYAVDDDKILGSSVRCIKD